MTEPTQGSYINVKINDQGIEWDSDMGISDVVFWLRYVEFRAFLRISEGEVADGNADN